MQLSKLLPPTIFKRLEEKESDSGEERDAKQELLSHHLDDIKEALQKALGALQIGNMDEVKDNIVIIQSSAMDAEEILTGEAPEL